MDEYRIPIIQVHIAGHDGPVTINESDFDPEIHTAVEAKRKPGRPAKEEKTGDEADKSAKSK